MNHAEVTIAFVAEQQLPAMLALTSKCPKLKVIVSIDDLSLPAQRVASAWAKQHKVELLYLTESTPFSPYICKKLPNPPK